VKPIHIRRLKPVQKQSVRLNHEMPGFNLVHNPLHIFHTKKRLAPIESQNTKRIAAAQLFQAADIVAYSVRQGIVNSKTRKIVIDILHRFTETIPTLRIAVRGQYQMKEHVFPSSNRLGHQA
jgi:hypothetical protein